MNKTDQVEVYCGQNGMSLRDYFAAQALQGLCSQLNVATCAGAKGLDSKVKEASAAAYMAADAMLAERKKGDAEDKP